MLAILNLTNRDWTKGNSFLKKNSLFYTYCSAHTIKITLICFLMTNANISIKKGYLGKR